MRAEVTFETADGRRHTLSHGDLIGRLWTAQLQLSDPRISEAHAMVSLRGGQLKLLALRGLFALGGKPQQELVLAVGQRVAFARDLEVRVVEVTLPEWVIGLQGDRLPRQPLAGSSWLVLQPEPALLSRARPGHVAAFWSTGDGWLVQRPGLPAEPLEPGWSLATDTHTISAVRMPLAGASQPKTQVVGAVNAPLQLELHWDTVHIHRDGAPTLSISGHPARLICELASVGTSADWEHLAGTLWTDEPHRDRLRRRFDTVLTRLRNKLKDNGIRADLIRADGAGNFALVLHPEDELDDRC